ncbi:MAG: Stp1/IreP family PP2C-type Ser/Thr phosphatase [bacterium]
MELLVASSTDAGQQRELNQDDVLIREDKNFAALFDGMGGQSAGELASNMAVETFAPLVVNPGIGALDRLSEQIEGCYPSFVLDMVQAIRLTNRRIFNHAMEHPQIKGMGTTVVAIRLEDNLSCIAHVGDSRAYRIRDSKLEQLTKDHSWLNELLEDNEISLDEAETFAQRNVITRALGINGTIKVDIRVDPVKEGDCFLLCSDGLTTPVRDQNILEIVLTFRQNLAGAAAHLIQAANAAGGPDNITVILMHVVKLDPQHEHDSVCAMTIPEESEKDSVVEDKIIKKLYESDSARGSFFRRLF